VSTHDVSAETHRRSTSLDRAATRELEARLEEQLSTLDRRVSATLTEIARGQRQVALELLALQHRPLDLFAVAFRDVAHGLADVGLAMTDSLRRLIGLPPAKSRTLASRRTSERAAFDASANWDVLLEGLIAGESQEPLFDAEPWTVGVALPGSPHERAARAALMTRLEASARVRARARAEVLDAQRRLKALQRAARDGERNPAGAERRRARRRLRRGRRTRKASQR
jgi:hypothetical protein